MTTTTHISGEVPGADVGQHATAGTIDQARAAVNARVVETTTTISQIEDEARQEIAAEASAGFADPLLDNGNAPQSAIGNVLEQIDLAGDSMKDIANTVESSARSFEDDMKKMVRAGTEGFVKQDKPNTVTDLGKGAMKTGATVAQGIAGTKLGVVSASLDGEKGLKPKATDGNLKGGDTYNAAAQSGLGLGKAPAPAPQLAAAPAGPGMGGGSAQSRSAIALSTVDFDKPNQKIGEIEREERLRDDAEPHETRAEAEARKYREKLEQEPEQGQTQMASVQQAKNPFLMEMDMGMNGPKPPSSINGEHMGGGTETV